jgi:8-oxo-dGTP diphosphatase
MRTIHKIAAVVIKDNKFLMVRKEGKDIWTSLGGRLEEGETEEQCLLREIKEEANCNAKILRKLGDFSAKAVFDDAIVHLSTYLVELNGEIECIDSELAEIKFIDKNFKEQNIKPSPTIEEQMIPFCIKEGLLDW